MKNNHGIYHQDKCLGNIQDFKTIIINFLKENNIDISILKFRALNCFGGLIRIYTGNILERPRLRPAYKKIIYMKKHQEDTLKKKNFFRFILWTGIITMNSNKKKKNI